MRNRTAKCVTLAVLTLGGGTLGGAAARAQGARALEASPPSASTDLGEVVGVRTGTVDAFLGVPYAAPPVGNLRFRPPQPHAPWATPAQATQVAQPCPQIRGTAIGSEDCLYLNVYAPAGDARARRPVMVWFPGGLFQAGAATFPYYNGQPIVEQSGVVVVTVTYRVGALGNLTAPAFDQESPAGVSGNYGLQDEQAALRWVRSNIAAFGGDPRNVTLFGESAGGNSVEYHMTSPLSRGLFDHAIIESASGPRLPSSPALQAVGAVSIPDLPLAQSESGGSAMVIAAVGCSGAADIAACLRAVPAGAFLSASNIAYPVVFPVIDGYVLPQRPLQAFRSGQFNRVPAIVGSNHDEGTGLVWPIEAALGGALTATGYTEQVDTYYGTSAPAVLAEYPLSAYPSPIQALAAAETDSTFACPAALKRRALSRYVPVFGYELAEPNAAQGPQLGPVEPGLTYGAYHTADLPYVFGVTAPAGARVTGKDLVLSQAVINYWTSMAIIGNPNLRRPRYAPWFDERLVPSVLSLKDTIGQQPESRFATDHHCSFWNSLLPD